MIIKNQLKIGINLHVEKAPKGAFIF